jgi:predicted DNA-binding transcriptional regulator AlpA
MESLIHEGAAAKILNCKVKSLQAWRVRGGGPPYVKVGRLVRYRPDDVREWIDARIIRSTSSGSPAA